MKILVIRFSSIGDIVLTTPIIRCLHLQLKADIYFLTKKKFSGLIRNNPYLHKVLFCEEYSRNDLKSYNFDYLVDLHYNLRSLTYTTFHSVKVIRYYKANWKKWMMVHNPVNNLRIPHIVDRYFDAIKELEVRDDGRGLDFFLDPEVQDHVEQVLPSEYIVLVMGATYATKRIPLQKCRDIIKNQQKHIVLLGGEDCKAEADLLNDEFTEKVIHLVGKTNLQESAVYLKHAAAVITGDTGMMHIAAAYQKPIYTLWGNTIPGFGMYPYYGKENKQRHKNLEVLNLSCRPCSKLGFQNCPKHHFKCMQEQDISEIPIL